MSAWINTFTGRKFYPLADDPGEIVLEDIAHALSNLCRYTGHTRHFYSVAEHSVKLATYAHRVQYDEPLARYLLLHDASEAYLTDIPRPLKALPEFAFYREAEAKLQRRIFERFHVSTHTDVVATAEYFDTRIIANEAYALYGERMHVAWEVSATVLLTDDLWGWSPELAERAFLDLALRLGIG